MKFETQRRTCLMAALSLGLLQGVCAQETTYPARPVTLIVPFAAGGSTDITARIIASKMKNGLGQPVVVDNKAGAAGNVGAEAVARSAPDGYTLLMATSVHALSPALYKNLRYDVAKDFIPVARISRTPYALVVNKAIKADKVADLIALGRRDAGGLKFGSAGTGSVSDVAARRFAGMAKLDIVSVPYKGGAPAVVDLLSGQIDAYIGPVAEVLPHLKTGALKALGVTSLDRSAHLPDVPAVADTLPGYEVILWNGVFAPAKTPASVVARINAVVTQSLGDAELKDNLAQQGAAPAPSSVEEFRKLLDTDIVKWQQVITESGVKID